MVYPFSHFSCYLGSSQLVDLHQDVVNQLNSYINSSNTANQYQSVYRKFHSTESALTIHNDILVSMDAGQLTALTLLDLSAAFDTIDHTILLRRLNDWLWEGTQMA